MSDKLRCEHCAFWTASAGAYYGSCSMGVVYGRVAFNDGKDCAYHSERGKDAAAPEQVAMQSASRGMTYQEWQKRMTGKP